MLNLAHTEFLIGAVYLKEYNLIIGCKWLKG